MNQSPKIKLGPAGPTMYPQLTPRPKYSPMWKALGNFLVTTIRAPLLAAIVFKYLLFRRYLLPLAKTLTRITGSERIAFGLYLPIMHSFTYSLTFLVFEMIERNKWFEKYRIGRTPGQEPSWEMKKYAALETARGWPGMIIGGQIYYYLLQKRGSPSLLAEVSDSTMKLTLHLAGSLLSSNVIFYLLHRLLHHRDMYELVHKKHHEFVGVRSVAAQSLHPIETILQTIPVLAGAVFFATHPLLWLEFLGWRVIVGMEGHSGYSFRGSWLHKIGLTNSDDTVYHDMHHLHTHRGNFGTFYLDWLFGTHDYWMHIGEEDGYIEMCKQAEENARVRAQNS